MVHKQSQNIKEIIRKKGCKNHLGVFLSGMDDASESEFIKAFVRFAKI